MGRVVTGAKVDSLRAWMRGAAFSGVEINDCQHGGQETSHGSNLNILPLILWLVLDNCCSSSLARLALTSKVICFMSAGTLLTNSFALCGAVLVVFTMLGLSTMSTLLVFIPNMSRLCSANSTGLTLNMNSTVFGLGRFFSCNIVKQA